MKRIFLLLLSVIIIQSCKSSFEKTLASKDVEKKTVAAFKYFEDEDYYKASDLFKALIQEVDRGAEVEKMFYYYALCDYHLEDYGLAAYEFERLIQKFPRGNYTEEAQFLIGKSNYKEAPSYQLDQDYTKRAIESFQLFLDRYPNSDKKDEVNKYVDELTYRLEKKAFLQAKLYYKTGDFQSAAVALEDVLNDFPDTRHHEEVYFLITKSKFLLAEKSVESKKIKRFKAASASAQAFIKKYPEGKDVNEAIKLKEESAAEIVRLKLDLPKFYFEKGQYDEAVDLYVRLIRQERDADKKNELSLLLFKVYHAKSRNVATEKKLDAYQELMDFMKDLNPAQVAFLNSSARDEVESSRLGYELQKSSSAYTLYKEGKYYHSVQAYKKLLELDAVANKEKHVYFLMLSTYKLSEKLEAKVRKYHLDSVIIFSKAYQVDWSSTSNSYSSKANRLVRKTNEDLEAYPILLVSGPMDNSDYKTAINRAQKLITSNISEKDKEEVVYLLIAAAVKHAKQGKRFERFSRFEYAEKLLSQYSSLVQDEEKKGELAKLKHKIEKGITKYQIKEE